MIYDDVLEIAWLQNANLAATQTFGVSGIGTDGSMNWDTAQDWIAAMNAANYLGYSDWRLPTTVDGPYVSGYSGPDSGNSYSTYSYSYTAGYNLYNSEMGYMYYVNLGNLGYKATDGTAPQPGWGLTNTEMFLNINDEYYWSDTRHSYSTNAAWAFDFNSGHQSIQNIERGLYNAWAVRPGDSAPVPEPATLVLMGTGLIGLAGFRKKFKK